MENSQLAFADPEFQRLSQIHEKNMEELRVYMKSLHTSEETENSFGEITIDSKEKLEKYNELIQKQKDSYKALSDYAKENFDFYANREEEDFKMPESKRGLFIKDFLSKVQNPITLSLEIDGKIVKSVMQPQQIQELFNYHMFNPFKEVAEALFDEHVISQVPENERILYYLKPEIK